MLKIYNNDYISHQQLYQALEQNVIFASDDRKKIIKDDD